MISLSGFNVVYDRKILNALALVGWDMGDDFFSEDSWKTMLQPKSIEVIAVNEDVNAVVIRDESWKFQFIPIVRGWKKVTE